MRSVVATFSQKVILASVTIFALMFWPEEMNAQQPDFEIVGLPQNSTLLPTSLGGINLATGSIHLEIPLVSQPDRGGSKFTASLMLATLRVGNTCRREVNGRLIGFSRRHPLSCGASSPVGLRGSRHSI